MVSVVKKRLSMAETAGKGRKIKSGPPAGERTSGSGETMKEEEEGWGIEIPSVRKLKSGMDGALPPALIVMADVAGVVAVVLGLSFLFFSSSAGILQGILLF